MLEQYQRTCACIDLDAVCSNLTSIKEHLADKTGIMAVIKADAYGHGAAWVARILEEMEAVTGYAVATAEEALLLRRKGIQKPVLTLGYTFPYAWEEMIREEIRFTIFRGDTIAALADAAGRAGKKAIVHLKVDTGMSRLGILPDEEGLAFTRRVLEEKNLCLEGIYTHFARADETEKRFAQQQYNVFYRFTQQIEEECGFRIPIRHCANSAGIVGLPETGLDMVRAGIILYGLWPSEEVSREALLLRPVLSWRSRIVYCKWIQPGATISYGGTFQAKRPMRIATIPTGYGDGYPRSLSNTGYVLIRGRQAPIVGRVCMDQFMVDVTDIPEASEEDWAILLGRDGTKEITAEMLGEWSGRFNYELVCDIGRRVPRIFYRNERPVAAEDFGYSLKAATD